MHQPKARTATTCKYLLSISEQVRLLHKPGGVQQKQRALLCPGSSMVEPTAVNRMMKVQFLLETPIRPLLLIGRNFGSQPKDVSPNLTGVTIYVFRSIESDHIFQWKIFRFHASCIEKHNSFPCFIWSESIWMERSALKSIYRDNSVIGGFMIMNWLYIRYR